MRTTFLALSLAAIPGWADAQSPDPARALVERAIEAGGGAEKISRFQAVRATAKVRLTDLGEGEIDGTFAGPDRVRAVIRPKGGGPTDGVVFVINGGQGWVKEGTADAFPLPAGHLRGMTDLLHAVCLADLLLALRAKDYSLELLDGKGEKGLAGVRVTRDGRQEVRLYFDTATGLLAKSMVPLNSKRGTTEWCECLFGEYKEFAGVKHFTRLRVRQGGAEIMSAEIGPVELLEKADPAAFAKP